jgi:hypothetical protein
LATSNVQLLFPSTFSACIIADPLSLSRNAILQIKRVLVASATTLLLAQLTNGFAAGGAGPFDGQWTGSATPTVQQCKSGNVTVTVEGTTL